MTTKRKDFTKVNTNPVYNTIAEATAPIEQIPGQLKLTESGELIEDDTAAAAQEIHKTQKSRKTYTDAEAQEALENLNTSGMKGVKLPRINLAFSPSNYEFIKIMAQVRGQTLTEFINDIIKEARETHAEIYAQAIAFRNSL